MTERPEIADGIDHQLDPRFIPVQQAIGLIAAACMAGGSFVTLLIVWAASRFALPVIIAFFPLWALVNGVLAWLAYRWPPIEYRHTFYRIDQQGIEIRRGVYWRVVINVPRSRVQHTDVSQGPIERRYGLGTLAIYTAGTDHAKVDLAGLEHATALRIREHLLPGETGDAV